MVITDVKLPDGDGIEILRHVKAASPETVVIVMTAFGSTETAVAALKLGAHDYLVKPFDVDELKIVVRNALEKQQLEEENLLLKAEFRTRSTGSTASWASSPAHGRGLRPRALGGAAPAPRCSITGESGTGKELVAKAIHALSPRRDAPFVSVNCGALPETLLESELFGHMKGAFTDAHQNKKGLFEAATAAPCSSTRWARCRPSMQVKLLRVLQEKPIRRVGGTEEIEVDVRVIAATNRPLEDLVQERRFREDLFYRLNVIPIALPPLRERREDIPLLAEHFLERFGREMGKAVTKISDEAMEPPRALLLAGQRPRAGERDRAGGGPGDDARRSCAERLPETLLRAGGDRTHGGAGARPRASAWTATSSRSRAELVRRALEQAAGDRADGLRASWGHPAVPALPHPEARACGSGVTKIDARQELSRGQR